MSPQLSGLPVILCPQPDDWAGWLAAHHRSSSGVWLKLARKGSGIASISYPQALEAALAWGWIDGQKQKLDDDHSLQRFTPRRPRSNWSKINVDRVEALTQAKRMQPSGIAEVEKAKADGRWAKAYDSPSNMTVPADLAAALESNETAAAFFETITATNRYAILYRIQDAKRPETRASRINKFVAMLAEGKTLH